MKKLISKIYKFFLSIVEECTTHDVYLYVGSNLVKKQTMYYVPRVGDRIEYDEEEPSRMVEVQKVTSSPAGGVIKLSCAFVVKNYGSRPDLSYIIQAKESDWNIRTTKDMIVISDKRYMKAHRKISDLVQVAEMYNDLLLGKHEEGFPFQIVNNLLNELKEESDE